MSSRTVFLPILLCAAAGTGAAAEPSNIAILPPKPHAFGFLTRPFQQRDVPSANLEVTHRQTQLATQKTMNQLAVDIANQVLALHQARDRYQSATESRRLLRRF